MVTAVKPLFPLGKCLLTPGTLAAFLGTEQVPGEFLKRHQSGDWGELSEEDKAENRFSVNNRLRILSAYSLADGTKIWVITEADRSATTILLPDEY